ncbi:hypothetical protein SAMN05421803_104163 [Nocardiopsis flavescens]|uniref:Uncharacterized protein n=1 Tax=Nocardiopsis flavescens TaxID=758803 RepID=A0A1M6HFD8_9ACTN|nr:hypothetical protein SAMN05421803_104163 [Nocardiopsis flavescens]
MGTIPARAGSTAELAHVLSAPGDHPRAGGEHRTTYQVQGVGAGPSPRGRGAQ